MNTAKELIRKEKKERTGHLDLGGCELTGWPFELFDCTWLETLILSDRYWVEKQEKWKESQNKGNKNVLEDIPERIKQLKNLRILILGGESSNNWSIKHLENLRPLTSLVTLDLRFNQIEEISPLGQIKTLQYLYLCDNQIESLSRLENLKSLKVLSLGFNQIAGTDILGKFKSVESLDLSFNQLGKFGDLCALDSLKSLNLRANQLKNLDGLEKLKSLTYLDLSDNQIERLPNLESFTHLSTLNLHSNQISGIGTLSSLTQLENLSIHSNQLEDISGLEKLTKLITLDLRSNEIENIEPLALLAKSGNLQQLDLSYNEIEDLTPLLPLIRKNIPVKWAFLEKGICVLGNPLKIPTPELIKSGNQAILEFYDSLYKQGEDQLYEAKLLIVGGGEAGKTTLAWKLKSIHHKLPQKGSDRTEGIDIEVHHIRNIVPEQKLFRMNVWDFGGQAIYHATHQFFLTKRSLYVLVNNTRANSTDFNYWLQTISLLSNNSPVIIVQNEVDKSDSRLDLKGLKGYFPNILYSCTADLSNPNDRRLKKLIRDIHLEIQRLDHLGSPLPKYWVSVRKVLEQRTKSTSTIGAKEFYQICKNHDINGKEANRLSGYLHDLGVFLHFQDDPVLKRLLILENTWATKGVYKILDNHEIKNRQKGHFSYQDAKEIWENTDFEDMYDELLKLMRKFELCYRVPYTKYQYISPQLLPVEKPDYEWDKRHNLVITYDYDFMPKGLISRLIVRLHRYVKDVNKYTWSNGCVFSYENAEAEVIETYGKKNIEIRFRGEHSIRLSSFIIKELDELNGSFDEIKVKKRIPCNCEMCKRAILPYFFEYQGLMRRKRMGKSTVECDLSFKTVVVDEILNGVYQESIVQNLTIENLIKENRLEEALDIFEEEYPDEAILLKSRYSQGLNYFSLDIIDHSAWFSIQQQICTGLLKLFQKRTTLKQVQNHSINAQLNTIQDSLSENQLLLLQLIEQNREGQNHLLKILRELEKQSIPKDFIEKILQNMEQSMASLAMQFPNAIKIHETWQETQSAYKTEIEGKVKLKLVLPFIFGQLEKEFSWKGGATISALKEDILRGLREGWKGAFLEKAPD